MPPTPAAALAHLEMVITLEGPQNIAGLILESVVGTNGVLVPPPGYLAGVRELCTRYGIVYIADEVMVGFGRTGHWFACQAFDVEPDLITFAKGVNSGYVPLGGVVISEEIAQHLGEEALTARELSILSALAQGWENKRIANTLGISAETVKSHVARIFEKIGARNRTEAIHIALRRGLVRMED